MTFSAAHIANWARMQEEAQRSQEAFVSRFINPPTTKKESTMIKPTIGRVVWLWPSAELQANPNLNLAYSDKTMPLAATVAYVWSDRLVNLSAVDQNGKPFGLTSVTLLQGDETYNPMGSYCEWMPYQKGQARRDAAAAPSAA